MDLNSAWKRVFNAGSIHICNAGWPFLSQLFSLRFSVVLDDDKCSRGCKKNPRKLQEPGAYRGNESHRQLSNGPHNWKRRCRVTALLKYLLAFCLISFPLSICLLFPLQDVYMHSINLIQTNLATGNLKYYGPSFWRNNVRKWHNLTIATAVNGSITKLSFFIKISHFA